MQDGPLDEATRRQLLETIAEEANRLTRLLENILQMSKLELGVDGPDAVEYPGGDRRLGPASGCRRTCTAHEVEVRIPPDLPLVLVDGLLLEQVFVNLLENAARYTPPGSQVAIRRARRASGWRSRRRRRTGPAARDRGADLREVLPGRAIGRRPARQRAGPGDLPGGRRGPRWDDRGLESPRRRRGVHHPLADAENPPEVEPG